MASGGSKVYTFDEVAKHNKVKDLWITIFGKVFDVSEFMDEHPGGVEVLLSVIGKNATEDFEDIGHSDKAKELMNKYCIGEVDPSTVPVKRTYIPPKQAPVSPSKTWDLVVTILQFLLPLFVIAVGFSIRSNFSKE